jgi:hypothetical protein
MLDKDCEIRTANGELLFRLIRNQPHTILTKQRMIEMMKTTTNLTQKLKGNADNKGKRNSTFR